MFGVWPVRPGADSVQNAVAECIRPAARLKASDFLPLPAHRPYNASMTEVSPLL